MRQVAAVMVLIIAGFGGRKKQVLVITVMGRPFTVFLFGS